MLKERIRKWLGIEDLHTTQSYLAQQILAVDEAQDRLKNMYDSNRIRIDAAQEKYIQAREVIDARVRALEAFAKVSGEILGKKPTRVTKKPTPKKGK